MDELLQGLNPEQLKAVTHGEGPLLIVAGAGTGKTTVLAKRVAWLIASGKAKPEEILALTFTEKAASELEERVDVLLPIGYVDLWALTFHGFGERVLRERGIDIGLPADAGLLDETGAWLTVRENLGRFGLEYYKPLGDPSRFIHDLLGHFSRAKDELVTPAEYLRWAEALPEDAEGEKTRVLEVAHAYDAYSKLILEHNQLDFGALIAETVRLFRERPNVLSEYRQRFKYILVDEFQDTNAAQYELVKLLAGPTGNLTVVGDDDQSIYKFRGASIGNILSFRDDFPKAASVALIRNYRSKQEILDVSHAFIKRNDPNRLEAKLGLSKRLVAERGTGAAITHVIATDSDDEADFIAEEIIRLKETEPETNWSDFAVLFRANSHARPCLDSFARHGIPHLYVASKGLYLKPIIQDAICYLKLLDNYHESPALHRVLHWDVFAIPALDIVKLTHEAKRHNWSLYETLGKTEDFGFSPETLAKFRQVEGLIRKHAERARKTTPARLLKEIFVDSGYYEILLKKETPENLEAISFLNQLVRRIQVYERADPRPTLAGFMRELDWELESGEEGTVPNDFAEGPDTVKLMTAHTAKGLEFRHVFVIQLAARRFPGDNRGDAIPFPNELVRDQSVEPGEAHLEEERRLFYVACTRAKDRLYLSYAEDAGGARKKKPSRFLDELFADEATKRQITVVQRQARKSLIEPESVAALAEHAFKLALPTSFSYSQLAAFSKCPLQYKYAHLLKIPTLDTGTMGFGKTIHAVLEKFIGHYKDHPDSPMSAEELWAEYDSLWKGEWYEDADDRDRHYQAGREALAKAHARTLREQPTPWLLEAPFTLKVGKYVVKGKIDRVDKLPDGRAVIYDYKTGKARTPDADMKEQLIIYQLALADVYQVETAAMYFWFVRDDELQEVKADPKNLEKARVKLEERLAELEASDFAATPDRFACKYCDFRDICSYKVL